MNFHLIYIELYIIHKKTLTIKVRNLATMKKNRYTDKNLFISPFIIREISSDHIFSQNLTRNFRDAIDYILD